MALGQLLGESGMPPRRPRPTRSPPKHPHFAPKAKRVIFLFMAGAPEPSGAVRQQAAAREVRRHPAAAGAAQGLPRRVHQSRTRSCSGRSSSSPSTASPAPSFRSSCRTWRRSPTTSRIVKSMVTDAFNHAPGQILMSTGSQQFGRPSIGCLGHLRPGQRVAATCPASSSSARARRAPAAATRTGAAASCPPSTRASRSASSGDPVLYLRTRAASTHDLQRDSLDAVRPLNTMRLDAVGDPEIATRINSFEMAFRMQVARPGRRWTWPASRSTSSTCTAPSRASRRSPTTACWPAGCVERGVRFVEIFHEAWDQHGNLVARPEEATASDTDQACAALDQGPEAARPARRHAGRLGRRVRPHADGPRAATTAATTTPTPSRCGSPAAGSSPASPIGESDELGFSVTKDKRPRPRPARDDPASARLRPHRS